MDNGQLHENSYELNALLFCVSSPRVIRLLVVCRNCFPRRCMFPPRFVSFSNASFVLVFIPRAKIHFSKRREARTESSTCNLQTKRRNKNSKEQTFQFSFFFFAFSTLLCFYGARKHSNCPVEVDWRWDRVSHKLVQSFSRWIRSHHVCF